MRDLGSLIAMMHIFDKLYRLGRRGHSTHPAVVLNLTCSFTGSARHQIMSLKDKRHHLLMVIHLIRDDLKFRDVI